MTRVFGWVITLLIAVTAFMFALHLVFGAGAWVTAGIWPKFAASRNNVHGSNRLHASPST